MPESLERARRRGLEQTTTCPHARLTRCFPSASACRQLFAPTGTKCRKKFRASSARRGGGSGGRGGRSRGGSGTGRAQVVDRRLKLRLALALGGGAHRRERLVGAEGQVGHLHARAQ